MFNLSWMCMNVVWSVKIDCIACDLFVSGVRYVRSKYLLGVGITWNGCYPEAFATG